MEQIITKIYPSPFGELILGDFKNKLCLCDWKYRKMRKKIDRRIQTLLKAEYIDGESEIIEMAINQLNEYCRKERTCFDLPIEFVGTKFQKEVWKELLKIPYGQKVTYEQLTLNLENKLAIRAVASANGANAISIIVPCHRVIGKNGELTGYAGGLTAKQKLLELEGSLNQQQLNLFE